MRLHPLGSALAAAIALPSPIIGYHLTTSSLPFAPVFGLFFLLFGSYLCFYMLRATVLKTDAPLDADALYRAYTAASSGIRARARQAKLL